MITALALWYVILSGYIIGRLISLPGANMLENFAIIISIYIPASLMIGWAIGELVEWLTKRNPRNTQAFVALGMVLFALWGSISMRSIARPEVFALVNRPDLHAMRWIRENIPSKARFLVEGFRIYDGASAVGSDAGWWISLLANRENTMPPQYALFNEVPIPSDYSKKVVSLVARLEQNSLSSPESLKSLCQNRVSHVYIGQGQGEIGMGAIPLFSPEDLKNPAFVPLYQRDRAQIFALQSDICPDE
jgi:hypothetical protein